ncbi:PIG-L deacetylase family protein [Derxia gummosa]|uniref:PIG-L deacetylase family protein n=1 Tax=Derxia gummosa DSM 723 TaxID=1121388 RepID=A0A8B6X124_9BURK|nr:PIG-L domain-containing protein [Derxia gummosa]
MDVLNRRVAAIVAHPDDETLGCGGTLHRFARLGADCRVVLALRRADRRIGDGWPALVGQFRAACARLGATPELLPDALPDITADRDIEALHEAILPAVEWSDIVLTHAPGDSHQAHRAVSRAVEIATRPFRRRRTVALFEVASSTDQAWSNGFAPNFHVLLDAGDVAAKLDAIALYAGEQAPGRRPADVEVLLRHRGCQVGAEHAEAFMLARHFA